MITAVFKSDSCYAIAYGLWQYDYGQVLRIQGLALPAAVEIHFSLLETRGEAVSRVGVTKDGVTDVTIPDSMLENSGVTRDYKIYAFVYMTDDSSGETEYKITMPVKARPKPEAFDRPEDAELFREAIAAVNEAADRAEEAARKEVTDGRIDEAVTEYLDENGIQESDPTVPGWAKETSPDTTLTQSGQAADAKAVGDALGKKVNAANAEMTGSVSMGRKTGSTVGKNSVALGANVEASGDYSQAEGDRNVANGEASHAEGYLNAASGAYSHVSGFNNDGKGIASFVTGESNTAEEKASDSFISGKDNEVSGARGVAVGEQNTTSGANGVAQGYQTNAIGTNSVSLGYGTSAEKAQAIAAGSQTRASGENAISTGANTTANGRCSFAGGYRSNASGTCAHAEGSGTIASGGSQRAQGKYNIEDTENKYAHIVGNGADDTHRSNAHTLDWQGNAWYAGKLSQEGAPENDKDLATKKYVDNGLDNAMRAYDGLYDGRDLSVAFAGEISQYANVWEWIKARIKAHNFTGIHVADYIPVVINGETVKMQVAGIDSYYRTTDQQLGHHIDFISKDCFHMSTKWNETKTNNGNSTNNSPYMVSQLYNTFLNTILYECLPDTVKAVISNKRMLMEYRYSANGALTDGTSWGWQDMGPLWVPTEYEVFGSVICGTPVWSAGQDMQYPIFANSYVNRVKGAGNGGDRCAWWLASVSSGDSTHACLVAKSGRVGIWDTPAVFYVPVCFRIDDSTTN